MDIGLQFDGLSVESVLCRVVTFPIFILSGKIPVSNEWLIIDDRGREIIPLKIFNKNTYMLYGPISLLANQATAKKMNQ